MLKRLALFVVVGLVCGSSAQAAPITYTNRALFEGALSSFEVDNLNGIQQYSHNVVTRPDFTTSGSSWYGCINHDGCGNNSSIGFDNAYLWKYRHTATFTFAAPLRAFGFDYANPLCCNQGTQPILQGVTAPTTIGFFGIILDSATTTFTLGQTGGPSHYMLIDNVTYGAASEVPEPASLLLLGSSLVAVGRKLRNRRSTQQAN